ncbi:hypothetical protein YPPY58_2671, partial [Yersinia pestis PY-58]
MRRGGGP